MADESDGAKVMLDAIIRMGIKIDTTSLDRELNPVLDALEKKLTNVAKASKIETGIFGKDFITEKLKAFTGLDTKLFDATKNMISYGMASKELDVKNQEFYKSLNPIGRALVDIASAWKNRKSAEKDAAEQAENTASKLADLDAVAGKAEGLNNALGSTDQLSINLQQMGLGAENAASGLLKTAPAAESATVAMEGFISVSTLGLAAVAVAVIGISKVLYQMVMQARVAREEFKKFDRMFGGIGSEGVQQGIKQLGSMNRELFGLGQSIEKLNAIVEDSVKGGLNFSRAIDSNLVSSILTLSEATGTAATEINSLYTGLLKTTKIGMGSITEMGNSFIAFNRLAKDTTTLGQVGFAQFKQGIESSANALAIAANKGEAFTNKMTKDIMSLTGLAINLHEEISSINALFESAGSMIGAPDSPFRTLLALSGGANINQMLSNQFDKTDAMLKGVQYLQEFNKSFGGNIQLTAQVAAQQLGVSKEMAIKMINMRQDTIADMLKTQKELAGLQTNAAKDSYEKVNSGVMDQWDRMKTMFTTFFQNAFGSSTGMQGFFIKLEGFITKIRINFESGGWLDKLTKVVDKVANWIGGKLTDILTWIEKTLDEFMDPETNIITLIVKHITNALMLPFFLLGKMLGAGLVSMLPWILRSSDADNQIAAARKQEIGGSSSGGVLDNISNPLLDHITKRRDNNKNQVSSISNEQSSLSKFSPDAITYGKDAYGNLGFMSIAQKQYALEQKKEALEKKVALDTEEIANNTKIIADNISKQAGSTSGNRISLPENDIPIGGSNRFRGLTDTIGDSAYRTTPA